MAYGDGTITQLDRDKWRVRVYYGKDPITGKERSVSRTVNGTKAEARAVRDQIRNERDSGLKFESKDMTFGTFAKIWQTAREESGELADRTLEEGKRITNLLSKYIGELKLIDITPETVESLLATLRKDRTKNGKSPSGTTMHRYYLILNQVLKKAVVRDLILRNPCDKVPAPKKSQPDRKPLTQPEAARLARYLDEQEQSRTSQFLDKEMRRAENKQARPRYSIRDLHHLSCIMAVRIALNTGMRLGEVFALRWEDVDLANRKIKVVHSITNKGKIKSTKSGKSRTISIDAITANRLGQWRAIQASSLKTINLEPGPVCCSDNGSYYSINNFEKWWESFRAQAGLPNLRFHELRHTHATLLVGNNVDFKTIQERLGHSKASTTMDIYAHALPENDEVAAALVGTLLQTKQDELVSPKEKIA